MKIRYHHDTIGVNSRLDTIQAAILSVKLKHLDEYNMARQEAAMLYDTLFRDCKSLIIPQRVSWSDHIFHQYSLRLVNVDRKRLIEKLSEKGIPAMVYYPIPLHKQKALEPYVNGKMVKEYPNSIMLSEVVVSLPMHTELTQEVQHYIVDNVLSLL
jgi:dTDP-4-amino-4,6-dideoxygalactose transaminase